MDAFYASVELRRRPELRGRPVIVCGSGPRAVVTTASYEARRLAGIHSAMPAAVARRRLPDAVYLSPDFTAYREASREVMAILRANAETVEVVGLDEAYVDLTGIFSPKATMRRIATAIREGTGLSCSIGISENRMLAKITSELGKPAGLVVLSRAEALERFGQIMPPVMGAVAFIMAETLGVEYSVIVQAAVIPAILYFASAFWMVHLEAGKQGLVGMKRSEIPSAWQAVVARWYLVLPLAALVYMLFQALRRSTPAAWGSR
jgi:DNA polymerase-4